MNSILFRLCFTHFWLVYGKLFFFYNSFCFLFWFFFLRCYPCGACCLQVAISINRPFYFGILKQHARSFIRPCFACFFSSRHFLDPPPSFPLLPPIPPASEHVTSYQNAPGDRARAHIEPFWIFKNCTGKSTWLVGWMFSFHQARRVSSSIRDQVTLVYRPLRSIDLFNSVFLLTL